MFFGFLPLNGCAGSCEARARSGGACVQEALTPNRHSSTCAQAQGRPVGRAAGTRLASLQTAWAESDGPCSQAVCPEQDHSTIALNRADMPALSPVCVDGA